MMLTKEQAKKNLIKLVEKYQEVAKQDRIKDFNEEATKTAFIQPLLKDVLGWDVNDYNEVSLEERISHGRVDYCLKIDNKPKIFVEAKPLKAELSRHIEQAVHYGYNRKGVPFVLLTDFEEIKLFDVTLKPDIKNPKKGLKLDLYWKWYEDNFDKLWQLSKESVISGELDKLLLAKPKDRIPVDKAILVDLEDWRENLAKDIFKNNPNLFHSDSAEKDADYLKEITQRILDRIIFMRFCEDRQFVHGQTLRELFEDRTEQVGTTTMVFLEPKFKQFDITFDSDLFSHKDWENDLQIDFRVMNKIVLDTYNPYQFDVIPLEVLGNIYEQYLGYTIRLTPQMVKYELKPEVRKAGGVYYTPEYIVDYIVKNTVGKLLKETTPQKIKKIRILDPACGSGSFLIRAYEEMLNYYREQKKQDIKSTKRQAQSVILSESEESKPRLSIQEKAEILKNHIFGVDIDEQAVEVTKLSLMLKMLEGEFGIIPGRNILPMLDKNIRCGNSLISGSPIELKKYFGDDYYKVKPFNWEEEFKDVFKDGGFDVVIGNPPYVRQESIKSIKPYLQKEFSNVYSGAADLYVYFFERGLQVLKNLRYFSFIVSNKFIKAGYGVKLRKYIQENYKIIKLIDTFDSKVFQDAIVDPCVIVLQKEKPQKGYQIEYNYNTYFKQSTLTFDSWTFADSKAIELKLKIATVGIKLKDWNEVEIYFGIKSGLNQAFIIDEAKRASFIRKEHKSPEIIRPMLRGRDVKRYQISWDNLYIILAKIGIEIPKYPEIYKHITNYKNQLLKRTDYIPEVMEWYNLRPCNYYNKFDKPKIIYPDISKNGGFYWDDKDYLFNNTVYMITGNIHKYWVGILNSKLISWYYKQIATGLGSKGVRYFTQFVKELPIYEFTSKTDKLHNNLVALVDVLLDLNKKIQTAKGNAKEQIQREIDKTDNEIDNIVYKLYGITEEEKKIIEGTYKNTRN
jgi:adenine-specific DNA-methyltransferase